jgi:hypothetical protein
MRQNQEKLLKESILMKKNIKETLGKVVSANDKRCTKLELEISRYMSGLGMNIIKGSEDFKKYLSEVCDY